MPKLAEVRVDNAIADDVEEEVSDGDPILQRGPVVGDDNPDVLETGEEGDNDPGDEEEAFASSGSADQPERADQEERRDETEGSVED